MAQLGQYHGGAVFSPDDPRDRLMAATPHASLAPNTDWDGREWMPPRGNQWRSSGCTGFGAAEVRYGMTQRYYAMQGVAPTPDLVPQLAPGFVYYEDRVLDGALRQDGGATMRSMMASVVRYGVPPLDLYPWTIGPDDTDPAAILRKLNVKPSVAVLRAAQDYRAGGYLRVGQRDMWTEVHQAFATLLPVAIAINVPRSFEDVGSDGHLRPVDWRSDPSLGGHCVSLWGGAADSGYEGGGFDWLLNHWDTTWGEDGLARFPWACSRDPNYLIEAWVWQ